MHCSPIVPIYHHIGEVCVCLGRSSLTTKEGLPVCFVMLGVMSLWIHLLELLQCGNQLKKPIPSCLTDQRCQAGDRGLARQE